MPHLVSQYNFEIQQEIADHLNPPKEHGNDWRLVASKLNFSYNFIENIKADQMQSPTHRLLENCTSITTDEFLAVLTDPKVQRKDVIFVMWECARPPSLGRLSDRSYPDSGIGRYEILSILSTLGVTGGGHGWRSW